MIHQLSKPITNLLYIFLGSLLLVSCKSNSKKDETQKEESKKRPNIVFIISDDHAYQAISAYGGRLAEVAPTPNIDRIAKEGMLFDNCLVTNSICGPSRAAILTGNYSNKNGYYKNERGGKFDVTKWTFPQEFQKNGYQTSLFGKWQY